MKYISRDALEQILEAYIESCKYHMDNLKDREIALQVKGELKAFEAVKKTLDSVVGIDSEDEV